MHVLAMVELANDNLVAARKDRSRDRLILHVLAVVELGD
jgi:hypothetical protein